MIVAQLPGRRPTPNVSRPTWPDSLPDASDLVEPRLDVPRLKSLSLNDPGCGLRTASTLISAGFSKQRPRQTYQLQARILSFRMVRSC